MKNSKSMSIIIIMGISILAVFTYIVAYNLLQNNNSSESYYSKVEENMQASIDSLEINNSYLNIETSGDAQYYCAKLTRSTPEIDSICWSKINNNISRVSVLAYKKYYVWIKDSNDKISNYKSINTGSLK
jgi:hypothetical protein